jgi:hypothetical protein
MTNRDAEFMHGTLHYFAAQGEDPIAASLRRVQRIPFFGRLIRRWFERAIERDRRKKSKKTWDLASDYAINPILERERLSFPTPRGWASVSRSLKDYEDRR